MRVLLDTNVLISAAYSKGSVPHLAYLKATEPPNVGVICEQSIEELRRVFNRKFPDKIEVFETFVATALAVVEVIPVPPTPVADEDKIRDADDRPILRAAVRSDVDVLISGDKDFLESGVTKPRIVTPAEFLAL
jgi:putative PIN family toxin of toxin-antitoxin system